VTTIPVLGDELAGPWLRVLAINATRWPASADRDYLAVLPTALSAAQSHRPLAFGWLCRGAAAPLELITNAAIAEPGRVPPGGGGGPLAPGRVPLFPAGARGAPPAEGWLDALGSLVWACCPARLAPPLSSDPEPAAGGQPHLATPTRFEAALTSLLGRPFGWLVVAEPTGLLAAEVTELRTQVNVLRRHDEERSRFDAERAQRRLAELDMFSEAGLWDVRVLIGAASSEELSVIAPVLVSSVEMSHHPYRLGTARDAQPLPEALLAKATESGAGGSGSVPFAATAGVLTALAGLPRHEVPGLRVLDAGYFDLTSETEQPGRAGSGVPAPAEPPISLGAILDRQDRAVGEFRVPLSTLNRHAFVTGATGAGKSQTVRHLLEQLTGAGLPWLVIEPVKSEYAAIAGRLDGSGRGLVSVINPADPASIPLSVNPLAPEPGYPVQAHIDMVRALFLAAFDADEPFPQIMAQALQRVYESSGWDVVTGAALPGAVSPPVIPTLAQLQRAALGVIEEVGYGRELQADVRGFVDVRLRSLRIGSAGRFFEGGHPADIGELLRRNVVLAIEDVANDEDKAFLMGTLIIRIVEYLRLRARQGRPEGLRHVVVIEEAHRLLRAGREGRASAHAVELFASMLSEIRSYGEGVIVAEQIPAKLVPDAVKNTALKVVHRLPAKDDRDLVGAAMNLDEDQSRQVVSLHPGVAAVFADGMDRPIRVAVPYGGDRERLLPGPPPPLLGRRSAACGPRCARERACTLAELRQADLLAAPGSAADAWLRVWAETLVLAFLTSRPLPAVPKGLRRRWAGLDTRLRECLLATVIDRSVTERTAAIQTSYDPGQLAGCAARAAQRLLDHGVGGGTRPGPSWVIPQVRWLHEMERLLPEDGDRPGPTDCAPPLDFDLPGLADWPGIRVGQRLRALRRHRLSMSLAHNQVTAWTALLGEDDQRSFGDDLAMVCVGLPPGEHYREAAAQMESSAWLGVVLSWPRRFVVGADQQRDAFH
jgi:Helicase HerA-like C-terminal